MGIVREYTFRGDDLLVWRAVRQWAHAHGFAIESLQPSTLGEPLSLGLQLLRLTRAGHFARLIVTLDRADSDTCQIRLSLEEDGGGDRWVVVELAAALHDLGAKLDAPELRETPATGAPEARATPATDAPELRETPATGAPEARATPAGAAAGVGLPPVTDAIDQFILKLVTADPDLSDTQVAAKLRYRNKDGLPFSRQAINARRRKLEAMGYTVR